MTAHAVGSMAGSALPGMKTRPKYYGTEAWELLIGGAWVSLCNYAIGVEEHRKAFAEETGLDLMALVNRDPFAALIDRSTGREAEIMAAWCDWVTRNLWGEDDLPNTKTNQSRG